MTDSTKEKIVVYTAISLLGACLIVVLGNLIVHAQSKSKVAPIEGYYTCDNNGCNSAKPPNLPPANTPQCTNSSGVCTAQPVVGWYQEQQVQGKPDMEICGYSGACVQTFEEVKPYVFADLPNGRIYKAVHEGCELFIVEAGPSAYTYAIATGRGCK
jgi:hypothetical protein